MRRVNLLPTKVRDERARIIHTARRRRRATAALVAALAWIAVATLHARTIDAAILRAEAELTRVGDDLDVRRALDARLDRLAHRIDVLDALEPPAETSALVALVANIVPESIVLHYLSVEMPSPVPAIAPGERPQRLMEDGPSAVLVRVDGTAEEDTDIAEYVRRLVETGVFDDVRLEDSREVIMGDLRRHRCRVVMEIALPQTPVPDRQLAHLGETAP